MHSWVRSGFSRMWCSGRGRTFRVEGADRPADSATLRGPIGIGTMMWGTTALDRRINGYLIPDETLRRIRDEASRAGVTFFDTAEGYGGGTSEIRLRRLGIPRAGGVVATKFLPTLWRWSEASFIRALRASNTRLGVTCCDVYFVHTPIHPRSPAVWVRAAAHAVKLGLMKELGVSNFDAASIRAAHAVAQKHGIRIVANQIMFNLLVSGAPSVREVVQTCNELGVAVVGYGALGQGLLSDNLTPGKARANRFARLTGLAFDDLAELRAAIAEVAAQRSVSMAQVCINWAMRKSVLPLVGIRSVEQLRDSLGATSFVLSESEVARLDDAALSSATFDRPVARRAAFTVFISCLVTMYRLSHIFADRAARNL